VSRLYPKILPSNPNSNMASIQNTPKVENIAAGGYSPSNPPSTLILIRAAADAPED